MRQLAAAFNCRRSCKRCKGASKLAHSKGPLIPYYRPCDKFPYLSPIFSIKFLRRACFLCDL